MFNYLFLFEWAADKEQHGKDIEYDALDKNAVKILKSNNIKINCWTCDNKNDAEKLAKMSVDFITSNILE